MPLSWNEIKSRALAFSKEWSDENSEHAEGKSFWDGFFSTFGVTRRRVASFEQHVKKTGGRDGYIDLLWKGVLLVEHKSRGKSLDQAYQQALDYFPGLKEYDLPKFTLVSDFSRFRLYDLEKNIQHDFELKDLHKNVHLFGFIAGYQTHKIKEQDPVNIKAAELMGKLHDQMQEVGYEGHPLEVYLVRLLFCLFAEDTGIFQRQQFREYIEDKTNEDGSDLGYHLDALFYVLNTPNESRLKNRDEQLGAFSYVNGKLFEERLPPAAFDSGMREALLDCCALDWGRISPAIFGSLFQSVMDKAKRRNLGAHYTSEKNILKLINSLFMDDLRVEFKKVKNNRNRLFQFHKKLRTLKFLDPACGCGNFLVIAYRELRLLELEVLHASNSGEQKDLNVHNLISLDVDQFYGIEIEEFPVQIAQAALWLMDHQMNMKVSEEFGLYFARIPLHSSANIVYGNALQIDWNEVVPAEQVNYIMGNPPFVGKKEQTKEQKQEMMDIFNNHKGCGVLDYVCCWYVKAVEFSKANNDVKTAFVSTNSISQGEQVGVLWKYLAPMKIAISFAHRTFQWSNEARGKAAVHCVIIGFSTISKVKKYIYSYDHVQGDPQRATVKKINPYLIDADTLFLENRSMPVSASALTMNYGSMPIDKGHLILSEEEKIDICKKDKRIEKYIKQYMGGNEFLNKKQRYCLWLFGVDPSELRQFEIIKDRLERVREFRKSSNRPQTRALADTPYLFGENRQPDSEFLLIPKVSF